MHIHHPVDFFLGLFMVPFGLLSFGYDLSRLARHTLKRTYRGWRSLACGLGFLVSGPIYLSDAFDPRQHLSHGISLLEVVLIVYAALIVLARPIAWIRRRRRAVGKPVR